MISASTLIVFSPVFRSGFLTWDDDSNFVNNLFFRGLGPTQLRWMWTTTLLGHYVPLSWMSLGLDFTLWGMNPAGYHLTNLLLHVATAVLTYRVAVTVFARVESAAIPQDRIRIAAATAALFYAIHPLRVESVAWVTERRDMLSELFLLASVLLYLTRASGGERYGRTYWGSIVLFLLSLLSKASGAALPAALLILDAFPLRRLGGERGWWNTAVRSVYLEKVPYFALSLGAGILSIASLPARVQLGVAQKIAVSAYSLVFYLRKTILPLHLSPLYPMPAHVDPIAPVFLISYAIVIAGVISAPAIRKRWPGAIAALMIFVVLTLPFLGAVQNGPQIAADRYTYLGSPALACLLGAVLLRATDIRAATVVSAACVVALGSLSFQQSLIWRDSETFWSSVAAREPGSALAHSGVGDAVGARGNLDSAIAEYRRAVQFDSTLATAENNLGVALYRKLNIDEALTHLRRAISLDANYADAHMNLGAALAARDDFPNAISAFMRALDIDPRHAGAHFNWGNALMRHGQVAEAVTHYRAAAQMEPEQPQFALMLGLAEARLRADVPRP